MDFNYHYLLWGIGLLGLCLVIGLPIFWKMKDLKIEFRILKLQIRYFDFLLKQNPQINADTKAMKRNFTKNELRILGFTEDAIDQIDKRQ